MSDKSNIYDNTLKDSDFLVRKEDVSLGTKYGALKKNKKKEDFKLLQKQIEDELDKILPNIQNILLAYKDKTKKRFCG